MWSRYLSNILPAFFFFIPLSAFAGFSVSEIMYDVSGADTGREWIEIQNTGPASADIAGWKLSEGGTNHKVVSQKGSVIPPGGYAVIAANVPKFLADWPAYSGLLFQSSLSLNNTGETLILKNASSSEIASATYSGGLAGGDGNSLNDAGGAWVARKPSPGGSVSAESVLPPPPKSASKTGNVKAHTKVSTTDGAAYDGAVAITNANETASAISAEKGDSQSFAMLPWIAALFAVIGIAGAAVFLKGKAPKRGSGYTIIEEK